MKKLDSPLFFILVFSIFLYLITGCGGGSSKSTDDPANEPLNSGTTSYTTISGKLSDPILSLKVSDWSGALVKVINQTGEIVGSATAEKDGAFFITIIAATESVNGYFVRASFGNLVLKAFVSSSFSDLKNIEVGPASSAIVMILGRYAKRELGELNVDSSSFLSDSNFTLKSIIETITSMPNFSELINAIIQDIKENFDPKATKERVVGLGGDRGNTIASDIAMALSGETTDQTIAVDTNIDSSSDILPDENEGGGYKNQMRLPDTGQRRYYSPDMTFGEDADYIINPVSYADNGDGTITDNITDLTWQKDDDTVGRSLSEAEGYCNALTLAAHSDWRLPDIFELITLLIDDLDESGLGDLSVFSSSYFTNTGFRYWSSTRLAETGSAWYAYRFGVANDKIDRLYKTKCVRGQKTLVDIRYADNGDNTITDDLWGLMWQRIDGGFRDWSSAISYCEDLSFAGYDDWRLPNAKEFISLIDPDRFNPVFDHTLFPDIVNLPDSVTEGYRLYWTSTSVVERNPWVMSSGNGSLNATLSSDESKTIASRCVRGGTPEKNQFAGLIDNGDGTITDRSTELIWQQYMDAGKKDLEEAYSYCANLFLGGYADWWLPHVKELASLAGSYGNDSSAYAVLFSDDASDIIYRTSADMSGNAWIVYGAGGAQDNTYSISELLSVRCTRRDSE